MMECVPLSVAADQAASRFGGDDVGCRGGVGEDDTSNDTGNLWDELMGVFYWASRRHGGGLVLHSTTFEHPRDLHAMPPSSLLHGAWEIGNRTCDQPHPRAGHY